MQQGDRNRRIKILVALTLVFTFVSSLVFIWFSVASNHPFADKYTLRIPLKHASALKPGASVTLAGILVGAISDIILSDDNQVWVFVDVLLLM